MQVNNQNPFDLLWDDARSADNFPKSCPMLAHYTSMSTLESILRNDEIWFSHPLYMNDFEELRFGIYEGANAFFQNQNIELACGNINIYRALTTAFRNHLDNFEREHAFDIYVFCLSKHDLNNTDGLLSMWRGYGGNGNGAAIIFDSSKIDIASGSSPILTSKIEYRTTEQRRGWINDKLNQFALRITSIPQHLLDTNSAASAIFQRLTIYSLFTKHRGFLEEQEWRVAYLRFLDRDDNFAKMLHHNLGPRGIEPKLKFKVEPIEGITSCDFSLEKVIHQIILGPTQSSPLSINAFNRMLDGTGKSYLKSRVVASTIPYRP